MKRELKKENKVKQIDTVDYYKEMGVRAIVTLVSLGCKKCNKCKQWMGKEYIDKDSICDECVTPKKEYRMTDARDVWFATIFCIIGTVLCGYAYAGGVTDNNSGNKGYILVSTGENNGANSIGTWTDPLFLKGDKGDTGSQGIQGVAGTDGKDGLNGIDGQNGTDGVKGDKGNTGLNGQDGLNGEKGDAGLQGEHGIKGDIGDKGEQGLQGLQGLMGLNGKDVDSSTVTNLQNTDTTLNNRINDTNNKLNGVSKRVSRLERTQFVIHGEVKFIREKHLEVGVYTEYNIGRSKVSEVGIAITVPIGESYLDRENKQIKSRLDRLERSVGQTAVIEKTVDEKGNTKSIRISRAGLQVDRSF